MESHMSWITEPLLFQEFSLRREFPKGIDIEGDPHEDDKGLEDNESP